MFRNPVFAILSMSTLVLGMSSAIIIYLWTATELTFDRQFPDNDKVFQVYMRKTIEDGQRIVVSETHAPFADYLARSVPGIAHVTRNGWREALLFSFGKTHVYGEGTSADSSYFHVFQYDIIAGDREHLLPDNHSVVLSEKFAANLLGSTPPIGQVVRVDGKMDLTVTGVFKDPPYNSSIRPEYILPISYHAGLEDMSWDQRTVYTYIRLTHLSAKEEVEKSIEYKVDEIRGVKEYQTFLFGLTDMWLHSDTEVHGRSTGRLEVVIAFGTVGAFILLMACVNFMNMSTARATTRAKEIGVRKMSGASRRALVMQFMSESFLVTLLSALVSVLLVYLVLPLFNLLTGGRIVFDLHEPVAVVGIMVIVLLTALLSGGYPALVLSSLKPAKIIKGNISSVLTGSGLRRHLVVFQFAISVIMIFGAIIVYKQINFLRTKDQGYDRHNVLYISPDADFPITPFKAEALRHSSIDIVGEAAAHPMEINGYDALNWKVGGKMQSAYFNNNPCDHHYIEAMGMKFVSGRNFSEKFISDSAAFIITRRGADMLGFNDPIGQTVYYGEKEGKIIGVVEDFQNSYMDEPTSPVIFYLANEESFGRWRTIYIRYKPGAVHEAVAHVGAVFSRLYPDRPFAYNFLDTYFQDQFWKDEIIGNLAIAFMVIAVSLACLGLFGLTLFSTQRRTKEIGIRKVLGASVTQLMTMLCSEFSRPIIISLIISLPVGFYIMQGFLESYLVRTTIGLDSFVVTFILISVIGLLTVFFQAFSAATRNPVEALKTE
jgi:putative ABC transport system permease protein